ADHLENFAGGGLLLQGLGEVAVSHLELAKEAHVLDGDDSLVGEGLEEPELALRELPDLTSVNVERPDRPPVAQQWDGHDASQLCRLGQPGELVVGIVPHIRDIDHGPEKDGATCGSVSTRWGRKGAPRGGHAFWTCVGDGCEMNELTVESQHHPVQGAAE